MEKTHKFIVEIVVADSIPLNTDQMAQNIANAIINECNTGGIVPEDAETFTKIVYVKEWYSDKQIIEHP